MGTKQTCARRVFSGADDGIMLTTLSSRFLINSLVIVGTRFSAFASEGDVTSELRPPFYLEVVPRVNERFALPGFQAALDKRGVRRRRSVRIASELGGTSGAVQAVEAIWRAGERGFVLLPGFVVSGRGEKHVAVELHGR